MLDAAFIRDNIDKVKENCRNRGVSEIPVDRAVAFDAKRKELVQKRSETAAKKNDISKQFPQAKTPEAKQALKDQAAALDKEIGIIDDELKIIEGDLLLNLLPDPEHDPPGRAGRARTRPRTRSSRKFGEPRTFDFKPKDHVALCEALDLVDFEAGTKVAGQKFYFLKNEAVLLELALVQYAMQTRRQARLHAGHHARPRPRRSSRRHRLQPRDPNPETRQVYTVADTDLCLIATAEITLGGMHATRSSTRRDLPKRYVGLSHCFRTEAGAAGRDTRGLYRVHQFTKVEMFAFCTPEQSEAIHLEIQAIEEEIFQGSGCRTTSSTPAPATSAARRTASTTSKPGCPAAARRASTAR